MNRRFCYRPLLAGVECRIPRAIALGLLLGFSFSLGTSLADDAHRNKIYDSNGFEPRPFVSGAPLLGVDGWSTAIPPFLNPAAARITDDESANGRQSVEVWGGDLNGSGGITAPYDAVGSYRRPLNYAVQPGKPLVVVDADLLLETDQPATDDDFFSLTIAARSGDGETLGEMGLASSGEAVAYGFDVAPGTPPVFTAPIEFNHWHRVSIVMDFSAATTTVAYFLDGELIGVNPTTSTSKVLLRGAMVVYALPDDIDDARADYTARFDNFRVRVLSAGGD
jgi:hypothetical protein